MSTKAKIYLCKFKTEAEDEDVTHCVVLAHERPSVNAPLVGVMGGGPFARLNKGTHYEAEATQEGLQELLEFFLDINPDYTEEQRSIFNAIANMYIIPRFEPSDSVLDLSKKAALIFYVILNPKNTGETLDNLEPIPPEHISREAYINLEEFGSDDYDDFWDLDDDDEGDASEIS